MGTSPALTNLDPKTPGSPEGSGDPAFIGDHRHEELQATRNPNVSSELNELLKKIDGEIGKSFTAEGAALLKEKLQSSGREDFSITVEQGYKALEIAQKSNDPEYISKALSWGGVALLEKAPNRDAFISYARERYPQDYSTEYRNELDSAANEYGPAFPERWKNVIPAKRHNIIPMIEQYSKMFNVNPNLVVAIMKNESGFDTGAQSPVGARGLMQVMPGTADGIANDFNKKGIAIPGDPVERNIAFGIFYLRQMSDMFNGDTAATIRAYNAGPGNEKSGKSLGFSETIAYLRKVTGSLNEIGG
jgi:hypothetical protein